MLNDAKIKAAKPKDKPYRLSDAGQLYLQVAPSGGKHWRMNYTYGRNAAGRPAQKTLAFGSYPGVTLLEARGKRDDAKALLRDGKDPAVEKRIEIKTRTEANQNTLEVLARRWHDLRKATWDEVHCNDVLRSLERDIFPHIGNLPITSIKAPRLLEVLQKVEKRGAIETAHRLRQRCSAVFAYGIGAGLCEADPAAGLGANLKDVPRSKKQPSIIDGIRDQDARIAAVRKLLTDCEAERCRATTKLALRFMALTAVRPNELHGARWDEMSGLDGDEPTWTIPAARMKGDKERKEEEGGEHIVPLSHQAVAVLRAVKPLTGRLPLVFPGERHLHKPMSENTLRALLIRAGYYQRHVPHGFRAAFSTIMNERADREWRESGHKGASPDRAIIDLMLAHVSKDKVEGAYNRAAYLPRRRELAQEWADILLNGFCAAEDHLGKPIRYAATGPRRLGVDRSEGDHDV